MRNRLIELENVSKIETGRVGNRHHYSITRIHGIGYMNLLVVNK